VRSVCLCAVERGDHHCNRSRDQPPRRSRCVNIVLLTTAVAVGVCVVMRHEGKKTGHMIDVRGNGMSNKIPPPTKLQIPATVTTLTSIMNGILLSPVREIMVRRVARLTCKCDAPLPPAGDYVISTSHAHPNRHCQSSGETTNDR